MKLFNFAEQQIRKAQAEGQFDNLKGAGKPLNVKTGGDPTVTLGYQIMADAHVVPKEIELKKAVQAQAQKLLTITDPDDYKREMKIFADLQMQLGIQEDARRKYMK